jgi:PBSX family phage terminase large subunit
MKARRYKLFAKQRQGWGLLEDPALRRYLFDGGARSGKTDLILVWLIKEALTRPGARVLVARWRLDHARTTLWNLSMKKILPPGTAGVRYHESVLEARFGNGSVIRVGGLDDAERVDKILGDEYLHIFINEATQVSWDTVTKVLTRLSQNLPGAVRKLILDCNPKGPRHWLHQAGVQRCAPSADLREARPLPDAAAWARLAWTPYDNPYLPEDTIATLEALPGIMRRRMLLGEWCNNEGAVYEMFDPDRHCFEELPPGSEGWRRFRAIDFGFTNPFCCLWGALDGDGRLWIYRELYQAGAQIDELTERIRAAEDGHFATVADPADPGAREYLAAHGVHNDEAKKDVYIGIQAVQQRFMPAGDGRPRLYIASGCVNTIAELYDYSWEEPREGRNAKEEPRKDRDHAMDALRYMVMEADRPRIYKVASMSGRRDDGAAAWAELF